MESIGEAIDRLITVDIGGRGVILKLYDAAREKIGEPLVLSAAKSLKESISEGDKVIIATGFRVPPLFIQETDGPPGAASIARAVDIALGAIPIMITEPIESPQKILEVACRSIGLNVLSINEVKKPGAKHVTTVIGFPIDEKKAYEEAKRIIDEFNPRAIIAIEKAGKNKKGVYHNMRGLDITPYHSKIEYLFDEAKKRGILTIGIGDGGNEVGMGVIEETVRKYVPYGNKCQCPCGGGIASSSITDKLIVASISNWGGYALAALLGKLSNKPNALHEPRQEFKILSRISDVGSIDSGSGLTIEAVDNVSLDIHIGLIRMLHEIIKK